MSGEEDRAVGGAAHLGGSSDARLEALQQATSKLRHDLRGALSPAMLTADRLLMSPEPPVRRAGELIMRSLQRAIDLLDASREIVPSRGAGAKSSPGGEQGG
jgi:hypothetical protein